MRQHHLSPHETFALGELSLPERFALWALRCIESGPRFCLAWQRRVPPGLVGELQAVIGLFQAFQTQMHAEGGAGLRVAEWGDVQLSRDERRLLRAVAACQAGQTEMADNLLFRFAPSSMVRPGLTQAVTALAATLAASGHWLPQPAESWPLPAGALPVVQLHDVEWGGLTIAWP
jgi:hypothetical protein